MFAHIALLSVASLMTEEVQRLKHCYIYSTSQQMIAAQMGHAAGGNVLQIDPRTTRAAPCDAGPQKRQRLYLKHPALPPCLDSETNQHSQWSVFVPLSGPLHNPKRSYQYEILS